MRNISFEEKYNEFGEAAEDSLRRFASGIEAAVMREPFEYLMEGGGKRIRPALTLIAAGICGSDPYLAMPSALSIEVLHNFTLVHDDIMDGSPMRRGRPAVHKKWDDTTGILLGDIMTGYAGQLLADLGNNPRIARIYAAFHEALVQVCLGQAYDIEFNKRRDITIDDYLSMIEKKTSALLKAAMIMGAYAAQPTESDIRLFGGFAYALGKGFQVQDDFLDLTASEPKFGKAKAQDLIEGKKTHLVIFLGESPLDKDERDLLDFFYQNNGITREQIPAMTSAMERHGIFAASEELAGRYFSECEDILNKFPRNYYTDMLGWLLKKIRHRNY